MRTIILLTLLAFTTQLSPEPASAQPDGSSEKGASKSETTQSGAILDLNQADAAALTQLPGIGPALAERIVAYRNKRPFQNKRDLRRVKGIGFQKFTRIAPLVTVGASRADTKRAKRTRLRAKK